MPLLAGTGELQAFHRCWGITPTPFSQLHLPQELSKRL